MFSRSLQCNTSQLFALLLYPDLKFLVPRKRLKCTAGILNVRVHI